MRQITVRQARRELSEARIQDWIPCEIVCDGKVVAMLVEPHDVAPGVAQADTTRYGDDYDSVPQTTKAKHDVAPGVAQAKEDVNKANRYVPQRKRKKDNLENKFGYEGRGLRFSKASQAAGRMR